MFNDEIWHRNPTICHYTQYETVYKILESKILLAGHYQELNDESEIEYPRDRLISELQLRSKDEDTHKQSKGRINYLCKILENIFIASFSFSEKDIDNVGLKEDDGILGMWRFYGKNEGCAIEFDTEKLWGYLLILKEKFKHVAIMLDRVIYPEHQKIKYDELIFELVEKANKLIRANNTQKYGLY